MKHLAKKTILGLTLALATSAVQAQTKTIGFGQTSVALSSDFVSALHTLGLTPGVVRPSNLGDGKVAFPITGGAIARQTALQPPTASWAESPAEAFGGGGAPLEGCRGDPHVRSCCCRYWSLSDQRARGGVRDRH